jgi:DNA-binding beta-propeller fold protein YncE
MCSNVVQALHRRCIGFSLVLVAILSIHVHAATPPSRYRFLKEIPIKGDTGWDYLSVDPIARRLYVTHGDHIVVVNLDSDAIEGDIADTPGVHGFAIAQKLGRGFSSNGAESKISIVDLKSLATIAKVDTEEGPDAILYEEGRGEVYAFNGRAHSVTIIAARTGAVVTSVKLPGKPEFPVADSRANRVFVNIEDKDEVVALDTKSHRIVNEWQIGPGTSASGMAIDLAHGRLMLGCENKLMVVMDTKTGKVITSVPIGSGVDANAFDEVRGLAFSSNGEGNVTIVHEESPDKFSVVQTLVTQPSARTMVLDPASHKIYLAAATIKQDVPAGAGHRRAMMPGSFKILVYGPGE